MATFKRIGTIDKFRKKFIDGMTARGYEREFAERCFKQIEGFGEYGFPESHAASFALLVYASCWIKCHLSRRVRAALLNTQPMGFYAPAQIVRDAQEHGVEVRPVDVNLSDWDCTLENRRIRARARLHPRHADMARDVIATTQAVRLGFRQIERLVGRAWPQDRTHARRAAMIRCATSGCAPGCRPRRSRSLRDADAFRSLGLDRRDALWAVRALERSRRQGRSAAVRARRACASSSPMSHLPPMPLGEHVDRGLPALCICR